MKIEYIWFKKYKNLENFGANLGGEYLFNFDNKINLNILKNELFIDKFFRINNNTDNKIDLTAIVGKNGVGKSTILDFISEFIKETIVLNDYILIYSEKDEFFISYQFQGEIEVKDLSGDNLKIKTRNFFSSEHMTLFFSNVFDVRHLGMGEENDEKDYRNISTNALIGRQDTIEQFLNDEFEKQIFFLYEYEKELEVIEIIEFPDKIKLELIEDVWEDTFIMDIINNGYVPIGSMDDTAHFLFDYNTKSYFLKNLLRMLAQTYFFDLNERLNKLALKYELEFPNIEDIYINLSYVNFNDLDENIEDEKLKIELADYFDEYSKLDLTSFEIEEQEGRKEIENKNIFDYFVDEIILNIENEAILNSKELKKVKEELKVVEKRFKKLFEILINTNYESFDPDDVHYNTWQLEKLKGSIAFLRTDTVDIRSFIRAYQSVFEETQIVRFSWNEMSSGQYGLLSLFSRFYDVYKSIEKEVRDSNKELEELPTSYLFLIDEADLYFHPQWQKDWLYYFLQMVEFIFQTDVQIVMTTHSPLVLSDFPNSNVIFINENQKVITHLEGSPRTFGANLNELFTNSFFINDGLIGKFGKRKINNFTKELLDIKVKEIYPLKDHFAKFIDVIGEPLIKRKLTEIYQDKINLHTSNHVEDRILRLEKELQDLKRSKGDL